MFDFVSGFKNWNKVYKSLDTENKRKVWIVVWLDNGENLFLQEHSQWLKLKNYVESKNLKILKVGLRYRSHQIETETTEAEAVYIVRSIFGQVGSETRQTYTIGQLKDGVVYKTVWFAPELIEQESYEDTLENCFKEALIDNVKSEAKII